MNNQKPKGILSKSESFMAATMNIWRVSFQFLNALLYFFIHHSNSISWRHFYQLKCSRNKQFLKDIHWSNIRFVYFELFMINCLFRSLWHLLQYISRPSSQSYFNICQNEEIFYFTDGFFFYYFNLFMDCSPNLIESKIESLKMIYFIWNI